MHLIHLPPRPCSVAQREKVVKYGLEIVGLLVFLVTMTNVL